MPLHPSDMKNPKSSRLELRPGIHEHEKSDSCLLLAEVGQNPEEMIPVLAEVEAESPHAMFYIDPLRSNVIQELNHIFTNLPKSGLQQTLHRLFKTSPV